MTLYEFMRRLEARRIHFDLTHHREDSAMVLVSVPGERWEVEFFEDGTIDVEVFRSVDGVGGGEELERLWREFSD